MKNFRLSGGYCGDLRMLVVNGNHAGFGCQVEKELTLDNFRPRLAGSFSGSENE